MTFISLSDLYIAYRKAKVEAFYENTHYHALVFTKYEQSLHKNLTALLKKILNKNPTWNTNNSFLGDYAYLPKSIDCKAWDNDSEGHFRALDPLIDWKQRFDDSGVRAEAKLRLVIRPTVDFQVISALWIIKVGHLFDGVINSEVSHGNRLRRSYEKHSGVQNKTPPINLISKALFVPYFSAYKKWRENGLAKIEECLNENKNILAITMDIEQFYHKISPKFLLRNEFLTSVGIELSSDEKLFTQAIIDAINTWYKTTPDFEVRPEGALPVGLSASKVISNVLLADFDNTVVKNLTPLYYGRYVDDVFLVFENTEMATTSKHVTERIADAFGPNLVIQSNITDIPSLKLNLAYAQDCELLFSGAKQKIFALTSHHGLDLIQHIRNQIRIQSSEYRLLPAVPKTSSEMASKSLLVAPDVSLQVDALRKADVVSVRRLGISLLLRDLEIYSADLRPESWSGIRTEFYGLVRRHVITPVGLFDFISYIPRVFGLMLSCRDFVEARNLISNLVEVAELIKTTTTAGNINQLPHFDLCLSQYAQALRQSALQAATERKIKLDAKYLNVLAELKTLDPKIKTPSTVAALKKIARQILLADWGRRPYKDYWYLDQLKDEVGPSIPPELEIRRVLRLGGIRRFQNNLSDLKRPHWPALAFPTRPLRVDEIALVAPTVLSNSILFKQAILVLRGAKVASSAELGSELPESSSSKKLTHFVVPTKSKNLLKIAITSFETTEQQWNDAATGNQDRSVDRFRKLNDLVNKILRDANRPNYIVFPELSIPLRWALRIARKLASNGISFLAGIEYSRDRVSKKIRNDSLVSLVTNWPGYGSNVVRLQPKFLPSHGEKEELLKLKLGVRGELFEPDGIHSKPTIYTHGNFCFSLLICSDLTNIAHRHQLRGEIDALFALEWNSDTKTFSSLVEATANDLHSYVIQANNRLYGDSRIRAPAKNDFSRDVVQVKGGSSDYYVTGEIDFQTLREEQRASSKSPKFKPTPIGFEMSLRRRTIS